jgi:hypothetical protein
LRRMVERHDKSILQGFGIDAHGNEETLRATFVRL